MVQGDTRIGKKGYPPSARLGWIVLLKCRQSKNPLGEMVAETQIEWTDPTWNPVAGCSIITAGCTNCYAMEMAQRLQAMGIEKYTGLTRRTGKRTVWNDVVREDHGALSIPYLWEKPRKIFVNSMSDLFHDGVGDEFILQVWKVMRETPRHNYQILTKRPERMAALVASWVGEILPNVWLGTSIENSDVVSRIDHLREVASAIRLISFEPLIGSVGIVDLRDKRHFPPYSPRWRCMLAAPIRDRLADGLRLEEIAIFVRSPEQLSRAQSAAGYAGMGTVFLDHEAVEATGKICIGTMHRAKGLEFRAVSVMACDDEILPLQTRIESLSDDAELDEVLSTERYLLYVSATRAREWLVLSAVAPGSEFLEDLKLAVL